MRFVSDALICSLALGPIVVILGTALEWIVGAK